jgi:anti-sigma regulatory factor (Ser/Thr protein kinase)
MNTRHLAPGLCMRTTDHGPLEPVTLSGAQRFRALTLDTESPDTGRVARRATAEVLTDWSLRHVIDDVTLCVSELIGNAYHHATPDGHLTVFGGERRVSLAFRYWPSWLFVEVSDDDSTPPMLPAGDPPSHGQEVADLDATLPTSGRGLLIVQHLADAAWWAPREFGGKSVFCRFDVRGGSRS